MTNSRIVPAKYEMMPAGNPEQLKNNAADRRDDDKMIVEEIKYERLSEGCPERVRVSTVNSRDDERKNSLGRYERLSGGSPERISTTVKTRQEHSSVGRFSKHMFEFLSNELFVAYCAFFAASGGMSFLGGMYEVGLVLCIPVALVVVLLSLSYLLKRC